MGLYIEIAGLNRPAWGFGANSQGVALRITKQ